jgi:ferric-dicitrate binding protein FerR (iron transport regulator)
MRARRRAFTAKLSLLFAAVSAVCLAQFPPPSDSGQFAATVVTMSGQVSVLKDNVAIALVAGDKVEVQTTIVTGPDGHAIFQVSDGSTFEVFPNSNLQFRKNAWNVKDLIDLMVGRIRVHIEHFGSVPNFNKIHTPTAVISVRGTTFEVTCDDEETTTVEVDEGLVQVDHALLPSVTKMVSAGQSLKVYKNEPLVARGLDKGSVGRWMLRAFQDAANVAAMRGGRGVLGTSGGGSSAVGVGDTGKGGSTGNTGSTTAPPAPAPPAPPPPPGGLVGAPVKHHSVSQLLLSTAKWLGRMVGITPPTFGPIEVRGVFE